MPCLLLFCALASTGCLFAGPRHDGKPALLPIGAFRPEWFMDAVHMSPDQAVQAHQVLDARVSVAMHFGTFRSVTTVRMNLSNAFER